MPIEYSWNNTCKHTKNSCTNKKQIFPLNFLIKFAFDNSYGIKKYGKMTSIVTSGVGLYGPNMRVLTKAEITSIEVNFK